MPELDYALLCDYAREDKSSGTQHIIAAGIDTLRVPGVPAGVNLAMAGRITFTAAECGRPHSIEILVSDEDGKRLGALNGSISPEWPDEHPPHWPVGAGFAFTMGLPIEQAGHFEAVVVVDGRQLKALPFRVLVVEGATAQ